MVLRGETLQLAQALPYRRGLISFQDIMTTWFGDFFLALNHASVPGFTWLVVDPGASETLSLNILLLFFLLPRGWLGGYLKVGSHSVAEAGPL